VGLKKDLWIFSGTTQLMFSRNGWVG